MEFITAAAIVFAVTFLPLFVVSALATLLEGLVSTSSIMAGFCVGFSLIYLAALLHAG